MVGGHLVQLSLNMSAISSAERVCKYTYLKSFNGAMGLLEILV